MNRTGVIIFSNQYLYVLSTSCQDSCVKIMARTKLTWNRSDSIVTFYIWKTRNGNSQIFNSSLDLANPMDTDYSLKFLQDCRYMSHLHFWTFWPKYTSVDKKYGIMFGPVQTLSSKILMPSYIESRLCRYVLRYVSWIIVDYFRKLSKLKRAGAWSLLFASDKLVTTWFWIYLTKHAMA
jgi:hypothetical protein